jgi:Autotransporter beta-domain
MNLKICIASFGLRGGSMKLTTVLGRSAFAFLFGWAIFGSVDLAQAQSVCSCPAGFSNIGGGRCQSQTLFCANGAPAIQTEGGGFVCRDESIPSPRFANGTCRSATPDIGQIASSQQQLSFSTVQGVLRTRRDQLQGPLGSPPSSGAPLAYSAINFDESYRLLGYAPADKRPVYGADKNPLYKAPPAPVMAAGPTWAAWVEGLGDWEKRNPLNANDIGRTQDTYGVHAGLDATWQNTWLPGDFVVAGLVTNWTSSNINLTGSPASLRLEGPGVGLYSMYVNGGFSADLVGKFDFLSLNEDLAGLGLPNSSIGVTNAGLSGNIQYKNKFGASFIEPTAGFSFTRTMFGDNAALMGLQDGSTVRLQAGARFGAAFNVNGISIEPTLALLAYSNVIADGTTVATVPVPVPVTPTDQGLVRGEVDPELNLDFNNGYSAYVRGSVRFGSELVGGFAKIGVRKQF